MDLQSQLAELKGLINKFMQIHNNPFDTSKHNKFADKLNTINPIIKIALSPTGPVAIKELSDSVGYKGANKDEDVRIVQTLLELKVDGDCGKITIAAIKKFQKSIPLGADGRIDAGGATWKQLKGLAPAPEEQEKAQEKKGVQDKNTPTITTKELSGSVGYKGANKEEDVRIVQTLLDLKVDGDCGNITITAIKQFQKDMFLKADGRIDTGGATWASLKGLVIAVEEQDKINTQEENTPTVTQKELSDSVGYKGANKEEDVRIIQTLLELKVDGDCGNITIAAIKNFQKSIPLNADGRVDAGGATWAVLKKLHFTPDDQNKVDLVGKEQDKNNEDDFDNTNTIDLSDSEEIKQSVGLNGVNDRTDAIIIQKLLKNAWNYNIVVDGDVADKTIQAIRQFQYRYVGSINKQDARIDPGGNTWKYLIGALKPTLPKTEDDILGGAEVPLEKKMAEFTKVFSGIQVEVSPGQFITVRPPYHINIGQRAAKAAIARAASSAVTGVIRKLGYGGSVGKATPDQIQQFLEHCLSKNLIKDKTSQGLHDFLAQYGISTDCSGLAVQAANFLIQGDMDRSNKGQQGEPVKIINTGAIQQHPKVSTPTKLRAGDMMVNYKREGTKTYHVRVVIDVDIEEDGISFTTVESGSATDLGDGGNGVGQRRWKFLNGSKFDNIQILKGNIWATAERSDQAYTYVRLKQLADIS